MATKEELDVHRIALALIQANRRDDEPGIFAALNMVKESDIGEFLVAITELVSVAFDTDPATGWDAFIAGHGAHIDRAEAEL